MEEKEPILPTALPVAPKEVGGRGGDKGLGWYKGLLYPDHVWGSVSGCVSPPRFTEKGNRKDRSSLPPLSIRPFALSPQTGAGGREVEEEGSWSPGPPPAAPFGRCEAWTMPSASGHRPRGALGAPAGPGL